MIHAILHDDKRLTTMTSYDRDMFDYLYDRFLVELKKVPNLPLFSEDQNENPGNRCMLDKESVFLLGLIESRSNEQQAKLGVWFDVDQSTVSRYLKFAKPLVEEILPTAKKMTGIIKSIKTKKEFEKLVPKSTLLPDGTEVSKERSQNKDERKASYSGKKKDFTWTTNIVTSLDGLILWSGKTFKGATHDLAMLKQNKIDLGRWSKGMFKKDTPEGKRITVLADKGYIGLEKYYPGIKFVMPKKKPKGRELTAREKTRNKKISSKRIKVEHAIGVMKRWKVMKDSYDGTIDDFELDFSICTGHANFKRLWDPNKKQPRIDY